VTGQRHEPAAARTNRQVPRPFSRGSWSQRFPLVSARTAPLHVRPNVAVGITKRVGNTSHRHRVNSRRQRDKHRVRGTGRRPARRRRRPRHLRQHRSRTSRSAYRTAVAGQPVTARRTSAAADLKRHRNPITRPHRTDRLPHCEHLTDTLMTKVQRHRERRRAQTNRAVQVTRSHRQRHNDRCAWSRNRWDRGIPPIRPTRPAQHHRMHPRPSGVLPFPDGISRHRDQPPGALPSQPLQGDRPAARADGENSAATAISRWRGPWTSGPAARCRSSRFIRRLRTAVLPHPPSRPPRALSARAQGRVPAPNGREFPAEAASPASGIPALRAGNRDPHPGPSWTIGVDVQGGCPGRFRFMFVR
jgi:hypothetical protein